MNTQSGYKLGKDGNKTRAFLRSLLKANRLEARQTYYDYYDSCHAPIETPNAEWRPANELLQPRDLLKSSGYLIEAVHAYEDLTVLYKLSTGYKTLEVRTKQ